MKRRDRNTGEFIDLCQDCFEPSQEAVWEAQEDTKTLPDPLTIENF